MELPDGPFSEESTPLNREEQARVLLESQLRFRDQYLGVFASWAQTAPREWVESARGRSFFGITAYREHTEYGDVIGVEVMPHSGRSSNPDQDFTRIAVGARIDGRGAYEPLSIFEQDDVLALTEGLNELERLRTDLPDLSDDYTHIVGLE